MEKKVCKSLVISHFLLATFQIITSIKIENTDIQNNYFGRNYTLSFNNENQLYGFGVWSQCIPQLDLLPEIEEQKIFQIFEKLILKTSQILFVLEFSSSTQLIALVEFNVEQYIVIQKVKFHQNGKDTEIIFPFDPLFYEGSWIFTMVVINENKNKIFIQISNFAEQQIDFENKLECSVLKLGGILIKEDIIIDYFRGLLSQPIIKTSFVGSDKFFNEIALESFSPNNSNQTQIDYLVQYLQIFRYDTISQPTKIFNQFGNLYALTGWIKHNLISQPDESIIQLIYMYSGYREQVNTLLNLTYFLNKKMENLTFISVSCYFHYFPLQLQNGNFSKKFQKLIQLQQTDDIFQAIQQWHFLSYEYTKTIGGILQIRFMNSIGTWTEYLGDKKYKQSQTNSLFYLQLAENAKSQNKFFGQIFQLKFFHNSVFDQFRLINQGCHPFCENCTGPFEDNCVTCIQNRTLIKERNQCVCSQGYLETQSNTCQLYSDIYPQLEIIEQEDLKENKNFCQLGYYLHPISQIEFQCFQCPQNNKGEIYCLECILNPNIWYLRPYCEYYLQSRRQYSDDAYLINTINKFHYLIDEQYKLSPSPIISNFCDETTYCSNIIVKHLNKSFNVNQYDKPPPLVYQQSLCFNISVFDSECNNCLPNYQYLYAVGQCEDCGFQDCGFSIDLFNSKGRKNNCGAFCSYCIGDRCQRYEKKYYLTIDGLGCRKNEIPHCLFAFQALKDNPKINTLNLNFETFNQKDAILQCARCEDNYIFVFSINQCLKITDQNCLFGVAESIKTDSPSDDNNIAYQGENLVYTSQQQCLISQLYSENSIQFYTDCNFKILHCESCLKLKSDEWTCLKCNLGYETSYDVENPCKASQFERKDKMEEYYTNFNWFSQVSAFNYHINGDRLAAMHDVFIDENVPNKNCHPTCLECSLNACLRCKNNISGRSLSLSKNSFECIECPQNCSLCTERNDEQVKTINPIFLNLNFTHFTRQCLISNNDQDYYDKELGQYINCNNGNPCKKHQQINLNLFCNTEQYLQKLTQLNTEQQKIFKLKNILFEDFAKHSFLQFQTFEFYNNANQQHIRSISILITNQQYEVCESEFLNPIINRFSENIFSALEVNIELDFRFGTKFLLSNELQFSNFTSVIIRGLQLEQTTQHQYISISFASRVMQSILLQRIVLKGNSKQSNTNNNIFSFSNTSSITIQNLTLNSIDLENNFMFFIEPIKISQKFVFEFVSLYNNTFKNFTLLQYYSHQSKLTIFLDNFKIEDCNFMNSIFNEYKDNQQDNNQIKQNLIQNSTQVMFSNFTILNTLIKYSSISSNFQCFINLESFKTVEIYNFIISSTFIHNSNLINLNFLTKVSDFKMEKCSIYYSIILSNILENKIEKIPINYQFQNIQFIDNNYSEGTAFFKILKNLFDTNQISIDNLNISNNKISNTKNYISNYPLNQSLIYLSLDKVTLLRIYILRGFGYSEISLYEIKNATIINSYISQNEIMLRLHQRFDCQRIMTRQLSVIFNIFSTSILLMQDFQVSGIENLDSPLIIYRSSIIQFEKYIEILTFRGIVANENLFLMQNEQGQSGIIKIETNQHASIQFIDCNFSKNIVQEYVRGQNNEALILNIEAQLSNIYILNTKFYENIVLNSLNSINYIQSKNIDIKDCQFQKNNLLSYELIQPYLVWDFDNSSNVFIDDILNIFKIDSLSGNGFFQFQAIIIANILVEESKASKGGGFSFLPLNYSSIQISNISINSIETIFQNQYSGILSFDLSQCLKISVKIENVLAFQVKIFSQGSLFYFMNNANQINIVIKNIKAIDVFSLSGTLVNVNFQEQSSYQQSIQIQNLFYQTTQQGWQGYLYKTLYQSIISNDITELYQEDFSNRTVILIQYGNEIQLKNISIMGLQLESAFNIIDGSRIIIKDIQIFNCTIVNQLVSIISYSNYFEQNSIQQKNQQNIQIEHVQIVNIHFQKILISCSIDQKRPPISMLCYQNQSLPPFKIQAYNISVEDKCNFTTKNITDSLNMIQIVNNKVGNKIYLKELYIENAICQTCSKGLLFLDLIESNNTKLYVNNLLIQHSRCGELTCFFVYNKGQGEAIAKTNNLSNFDQFFNFKDVIIENYFCKNNTAKNGTCLNIQNLRVIVKKSYFSQNNATIAGGAMYFNNNSNYVVIENSYIGKNVAILGGGIYLYKQFSLNYKLLHTDISNNLAYAEGQNIYSNPQKLGFQYGLFENYCTILSIKNNSQVIDQVTVKEQINMYGIFTEYLLFPNGQQVKNYKYFDWKNRKYLYYNLYFRIIPLLEENQKYINLENKKCQIQSRIRFLDQEGQLSAQQFTNNYTNYNQVVFDEVTQDYNLDDLRLYFPEDNTKNSVLELEFQCGFVSIPIFNKLYPYNYLSKIDDYSLRFLFKPFPCQFGEVKNLLNNSCDVCDSSQGFFILKINQTQCEIKDDISTYEVTPAQIKLRSDFWRPYLDTSIVSYCENLPTNCLGGWVEGDTSCRVGHIGALCEECDLQNLRGDGRYFRQNQYNCKQCQSQTINFIIITYLSIYILISIILAVINNNQSVEQQLRIIKIKLLGFRVFFQYNQKAILYKLITNYLQILSVVSNLKSNFQQELLNILNFTTHPASAVAVSFDCSISEKTSLSIHYIRIILQLLQPFLYIILIFLFYFIGLQGQCFIQFNRLVVPTTLIYIYLYFQPNLIGKLVEIISFRDISYYKWIIANVAYRYDEQIHTQLMISLFIPILILLGFLIPLFFFYCLLTNKHQLDNKSVRLRWGYLYCEYKNDAYLWEVLRIVKKIFLLGLINYYQDFPIIQSVIIILILILYLQFSKFIKPYSSQKLNFIDYSIVHTCLISICLILITANKLNAYYLQSIQQLIFLALNFRVFKLIIKELSSQYFSEFSMKHKSKLDKIRDYFRNRFPFLLQIHYINRNLQNQQQKEKRLANLYKKLKSYLISNSKKKLEKRRISNIPTLMILTDLQQTNCLIQKAKVSQQE